MIKSLLIALCCFHSLSTFAQDRSVTGKVTDKKDGQPMTGVTVVVKGTTKGASTDIDGNYSVELTPGEDSLLYSFIGYTTLVIKVGDRNVVDAAMSVDVTTLSEMVVVGYGTQRKSDLTGAVSSVRGSDLTKITSNSAVQALQGKVAGVQVTSTSGEPGVMPVVRVRGVGTFNNRFSNLCGGWFNSR